MTGVQQPVSQPELQAILEAFSTKNSRLEEILTSIKCSANRLQLEPPSNIVIAMTDQKGNGVHSTSMVDDLNVQLNRLNKRLDEAMDIDNHLKRVI